MKQKTYSDIKPEKRFSIENVENGKCTVLFYDNIQEETQEISSLENEETTTKLMYSYDLYALEVTYRQNLAEEVEKNLKNWLNKSKEKDYNEVASKIRKKRDELLASTDWTQMRDVALSEEEKEKYRKYRQDLRHLPQQKGFPYDINFPSI